MERAMRGRWSLGVVAALVVAVFAAVSSGERQAPVRRAQAPVEVTLALQAEGASVRISHHALHVTLRF